MRVKNYLTAKDKVISKEVIKRYWDNEPCGTRGIPYPIGSLAYYETIAERRDRLEPFIVEYAQFDKWRGKKVLEVGCGVGSDLIRFAQAGADVTGIDLSSKSVFLTRERLKLYRLKGDVLDADAEVMPFSSNMFDMVYCWGVLHHTPDTEKAINEICRVAKSGGKICVMLYHLNSIVSLQVYLAFGFPSMCSTRDMKDLLAYHHESQGTRAYTVGEVKQMFASFKNLRINTRITSYDLRYGRNRYLPMWVGKIIPQRFGWNIIVRCQKP